MIASEPVEPTAMKVVEHPLPTVATVKQLYASAFRCAMPGCSRPLYKTNDDTGDLVLNSRIAHIHARRAGGPRWMDMTPEENRSASNLVLLCIEHSYEVDDFPVQFPADMLRKWKQSQLEEYQQIQRGWPLSDAEAGQAIGASSAAVEHHHAGAILGTVRAVERLILAARNSRRGPATQATAWLAATARARRITAYDQEGNAIYAEPSSSETRQHRTALHAALAQACYELTPVADEVKVELAAARASRPAITKWVSWVSRAVDDVLAASGTWPGLPELKDNGQLEAVLDELAEARGALSAAWRGEEAPSPPPEPQPEPPVVEHDPLKDHRALLARARPYARVEHRPYDPVLRAELAKAASAAARIPPVMSALVLGLDATCSLAAAVAANAEDDELAVLTEQDAMRRPLSAACCLLSESARIAEKRGRRVPQERAEAALLALWHSVDWSNPASFDPEDFNLLSVLWTGARITSPKAVEEKLTNALKQRPDILHPLVTASAGWVEELDRESGEVRERRRRYSQLPPWLPVSAVVEAAASSAPVAVDQFGETASDNAESLLAQVLWAVKQKPA
ncbi:HNH endonuclease signature motif containing protein [Mycetocola zhujimingii]|uniref:HNH endonuclease n=1 Tax=Mycetocola zhujimingii TaxID=2079792 RepID=A0A2U1TCQ4_9MICO|nr:HNH endonuclease signature motif containing protein [Mycetocola zhujimingii]PWC06668.1 hypothetical protein DF223_10425 [Mycetocola zhujimingii]